MRSRTLSTLPGRCSNCWLRSGFCVCGALPKVEPKTQLLLVRHVREAEKSTGTARVASLSIPSLKLFEFNDDPELCDATLKPHVDGAWILFPDVDADAPKAPAGQSPKTLVVLDGTWRQTRRMLKKLPSLQSLPRFTLPAKEAAPLRLRESPDPEARSTLEAIADALDVLESKELARPLHELHALFVERTFRARGVWELKRPYDPVKDGWS